MKGEENNENIFCSSQPESISSIEKIFKQFIKDSSVEFLEDAKNFAKASEQLKQDIQTFQKSIENIPIISFIVLWAKNVQNDIAEGDRKIQGMSDLLKTGVFELTSNSKLLALCLFPDHNLQIDCIRSNYDGSLEAIEELVEVYLDFSNWLSRSTFGYISRAEDIDRQIARNRKIRFHKYLMLIAKLGVRDRLLAKLFYFGKSPKLEEVFSLRLEDVNFDKKSIAFSKGTVKYPSHVFEDLKEVMMNRTNGFIFTNRVGERLDFSVPYRNFKRVLSKLDFDHSITLKDLSVDI